MNFLEGEDETVHWCDDFASSNSTHTCHASCLSLSLS